MNIKLITDTILIIVLICCGTVLILNKYEILGVLLMTVCLFIGDN